MCPNKGLSCFCKILYIYNYDDTRHPVLAPATPWQKCISPRPHLFDCPESEWLTMTIALDLPADKII